VEFENVFLIEGIFLQLGAKNYIRIEKINYFGNYMDPCPNFKTPKAQCNKNFKAIKNLRQQNAQ